MSKPEKKGVKLKKKEGNGMASIAPGFSQGIRMIFSLLALAKSRHWAKAH